MSHTGQTAPILDRTGHFPDAQGSRYVVALLASGAGCGWSTGTSIMADNPLKRGAGVAVERDWAGVAGVDGVLGRVCARA